MMINDDQRFLLFFLKVKNNPFGGAGFGNHPQYLMRYITNYNQ